MNKLRWILVAGLGATLMTGCKGGSDNTIGQVEAGAQDVASETQDSTVDFKETVIDAISSDTKTYFDLATGSVVELTAEEAASSTDWDLAFQRYKIQLNGGDSGPGLVVGALGDEQAEFYDANGEPVDSVFLNATPDSELEHLLAEFQAPSSWLSDSPADAFGDEWYNYDMVTGNITQNDTVGYLVRSNKGDSYARLRVVDFTFPTRQSQGITSFDLQFDVQPSRMNQFSAIQVNFTGSVPAEGGERCYDFDAAATVDCFSSNDWDVRLGFYGRDLFLNTNSGPYGSGQGGALGAIAWEELKNYTSATTSPQGHDLRPLYVSASTGGIFVDRGWYAYDLSGRHQLWPNYRVYLIDTDSGNDSSPVYALQVVGYYGEDGTSGQPVIRWREVSLQEAQ